MRMTPRLSALLAVLLLAPSAPLGAQSGNDVVPRELVEALLVGYGPGSPQVLVGRAPEDLPPEILPPDGRIVGGMVSPGRSTAIVALAADPGTALGAAERRLEEAGWRRRMGPQERGGFVTAPVGRFHSFCREDGNVSVSAVPSSTGSVLRINLSRSRSPRAPLCGEVETRPTRPLYVDVAIPPLYPPAGAESRGGGSGGSDTHRETTARLRTALSAAELVAHFARQLQGAGWRPASPAGADAAVMQRFLTRDPEGREWVGVLLGVELPGGEREMVFRAVHPSGR